VAIMIRASEKRVAKGFSNVQRGHPHWVSKITKEKKLPRFRK
jgi:hypothetical protein